MSLAAAHDLLACPRCRTPLAVAEREVSCRSGHRFDVARQGYVNLLGTPPPANADTPAMLDARARFLGSGAYDRVAEALVAAVRPGSPRELTVAEAGAGTAWYLSRVVAALPSARGVALDVSVAAARRAAGAGPRIASVVADTWRGLPLLTRSLDVVLCVFAPRHPAEFLRVLKPGGRLVVVHPNAGHLEHLRRTYGLLDVDPDKEQRLATQLSDFAVTRHTVAYRVDGTASQVADLVAMGPNAFHGRVVQSAPSRIDVDVSVLVCEAPPAREP